MGEATVVRLNTRHLLPQRQPQHGSVLGPHRPSPKGTGGNVVAEVRGVGKAIKEIGVADVVEMKIGRGSHHPEARVLKTAQVRHASIMRVLSSKMTTGKCPKAEMLSLDIISTAEMPCSTHLVPSLHFQSACCQIPAERGMIKKITIVHASIRTAGEPTILTNPQMIGRESQCFA